MKPGTRVRLKVRTIFGWKGCGTIADVGDPVRFWADDGGGIVTACRGEVAVMRDQTPNTDHVAKLAARDAA